MARIAFARGGAVLFRLPAEGAGVLPRIGEAVLVDGVPHEVVDVEHFARPPTPDGRRTLETTVHLRPVREDDWALRRSRRTVAPPTGGPPIRY